jgi:hypothetical protein
MVLASEILARAHEQKNWALPHLSDRELVQSFLNLDNEIHLLRLLKWLNATNTITTQKKNTILIFKEWGWLDVKTFKDATDALKELFRLEQEKSPKNIDIVLVRADSSEEIKLAFKNYFSDATDFINLIDKWCNILYNAKKLRKIQ